MDKVLYCFMGITAVMDLAKREIPGWVFWVFGIVGVVGRIWMISNSGMAVWPEMAVASGSAGEMAVWPGMAAVSGSAGELALWRELAALAGSVAVGVLLLVISSTARGAVGEGDGWFFIVSGLYVSWKINLGLLCYGLIFSSLYGILLTVRGTVKGISVRKKKIPFLPFVSMAGIFMHVCRMWQ